MASPIRQKTTACMSTSGPSPPKQIYRRSLSDDDSVPKNVFYMPWKEDAGKDSTKEVNGGNVDNADVADVGYCNNNDVVTRIDNSTAPDDDEKDKEALGEDRPKKVKVNNVDNYAVTEVVDHNHNEAYAKSDDLSASDDTKTKRKRWLRQCRTTTQNTQPTS